METTKELIEYFHPPREVLVTLSNKEMRTVFNRNLVILLIGMTLFNFTVKDPQGNVLIAMWDALVTVIFIASGLEGFRLMRWLLVKNS